MQKKKIEHLISKHLPKMGKMKTPIGLLKSLTEKVSKDIGFDVSLDEVKKCLKNMKLNGFSGLDEFIDDNGSFISGDYNPNKRETFVGINRPETSREFAMFTAQGPRYYYTPHYGASKIYTRESIAENKMKSMIEDLVKNKTSDYDVMSKDISQNDMSTNIIPDLSTLKSEYQKPIISRKAKYLGDMMEREGVSGEEIAIVINHLLSTIDVEKIPSNYKKILINKILNVKF
jgi:hypothetical protein